MDRIRARLTYANLMSTLAVFLVLGGGAAVAAKQQQKIKRIGTNQVKAGAITTGKLRNKAVSAVKLRDGAVGAAKLADGSVSTAKIVPGAIAGDRIAPGAVTGDKVVASTLAEVPAAASAQPAAFARVNANGVVDAANSKAITSLNVTHPATGVYCAGVPSFVPRGAQATTQLDGAGPTTAQVAVGGTPSCPFPAVGVRTWSGVVAADVAFYLVVYR